ncbi:unnamed protein product [Prunus brigantina]
MSASEHVGFLNRDANKPIDDGYCNPMKKSGPISMDHVLMALRETEERPFQFLRCCESLVLGQSRDRGRVIGASDSAIEVCQGSYEGSIISSFEGTWMTRNSRCIGFFRPLMVQLCVGERGWGTSERCWVVGHRGGWELGIFLFYFM